MFINNNYKFNANEKDKDHKSLKYIILLHSVSIVNIWMWQLTFKCCNTVYGKTFEWENFRCFCSFLADRGSFPLESLAVYSKWWPRSDAPQKVSSE